ncbi:ABC transporter permease [Natronosalvus rutilus]|uniref:ABC transporter permease n=1 Tax=Natronosalvus rutilus TaxID=2953753 RepID=A0A9E7SW89_9EURY|nr:ABC transporter permease [Natronosalvus rutilus]UTF54777.1 ABC transporter permease [Natronosalvus rutilus]
MTTKEYTTGQSGSSRVEKYVQSVRQILKEQGRVFIQSRMALAGVAILLFYTFVAIFAPILAPYGPQERHYAADGSWMSLEPPSLAHPLGTTESGYDVLSQVIMGSRIALFVGLLGAFMVAVIGTAVGVVAGYYGGAVDEGLMRFVDILYGLPFVPFVIVITLIFTPSIWNIIFGIALLYWLSTARVVRSEVLSIKERPYIEAAQASGASHRRVMFVHVLPNVLPISALYAAIAVGYSITAEASISFLGFGDPSVASWGVMLNQVYHTQSLEAWWWLLPPGLSITLVVMGAYLAGRGYEEIVNPQLREP